MSTTYLDLINDCDNFSYDPADHAQLYKLHLPDSTESHGYILPSIVQTMPWTPDCAISHTNRTVTVHDTSNGTATSTAVTAAFSNLVSNCITQNLFKCIGGRHSEPAAILSAPYPASVERFASSLFGITGRGAHMTVYTTDPPNSSEPSEMKIWVPRRSAHLATYPNMLDTSVAGGVEAGETPFESLVREAGEEASLAEELVRRDARSVGCLTYVGTSVGENGWERGLVMPDVLYCYDLKVGPEVVLSPRDDEVGEFLLMGVEEVKEALLRREFKTNCAMVMIDFFIRHGIITAKEEKDYAEIIMRMHRRLPFRVA